MSTEVVENLTPEARRSLFAQFLFGEETGTRPYVFWKELGQWADSEKLWPVGYEDDARIAAALRQLLGLASVSVSGPRPAKVLNVHASSLVAARRLFACLPADEAVPSASLTDSAVMGALREAVEWGFLEGRDVSSAIEAMLRPSVAYSFRVPDGEYLELCALCVWVGRKDLLESLPALPDSIGPAAKQYARFRSACFALFLGNLLEADAGFEVLTSAIPRGEDAVRLTAAYLLALTVHFQLCAAHQIRVPDRPRCIRLVNNLLLQGMGGDLPRFVAKCTEAESAVTERRKRLSDVACTVMQLLGGSGSSGVGRLDSRYLFGGLAFVLRFALLSLDERAKIQALVPEVFQLAEVALAGGYPTLGALFVAVLGGSLPEGFRSQIVDVQRRLEEAGAAWIWPIDHPVEAWRTALDDLSEVLSRDDLVPRTAPQPKDAKISWKLVFSSTVPRQVLSVAPCLRRPRGAQDGTNDQEETLVSVANGRYAPCMTDVDREVALSLLGAGYDIKQKTPVPLRALEILCRHPRVVSPDERGILREISFTPGECPIRVETGTDGGLRLSLPFQGRIQKESYAILQTAPFAYSYVALKPEVRAVVSVFGRHAPEGVLEVPQDGLAQTQRILRKALERLPLVGALSVVADLKGIEHVSGDSTAVVRLNWSGEILEVSVWVLPLPESQIPFFPGSGERESLVARNGRTVILVRDFEAEQEGFARVATALEPFKDDYAGNGRWEIGSLDGALAVLSTLRTLSEGVRCEWSGRRRLGVRQAQRLRLKASAGISWFDVQGHLAVDEGMVYSVVDVLRRLGGRVGRFVAMGDDMFVELTEDLERKLDALQQAAQVEGMSLTVARAAVPMLEEAFVAEGEEGLPEVIQVDAEAIRKALLRKPAVPKTLKGKLRPYQKEGYSWLSRLAFCSFGACLADDMGLGKTVQVISLLLERAENGVSLVVAPASVCLNWRNELARFAPSLTCVLANEIDAETERPFAAYGAGTVVVTSYGLLVSRLSSFAPEQWNGIVLDESQAIKNEDTRRAQAVKELKSAFRVAATGTPVENNLTELWSLFDFLNPGLLGNVREFASRFVREDGTATEGLKKLVSPFVLRRLKRDVLDDLPPKTEIVLPVPLDGAERAAYEACRREALDSLKKAAENGKPQNRIGILAQLMRLRRFCCHPSLVLPDARNSTKMDVLLQLLEDLRANHHHALVFSQFTDYLAIVRRALDEKGWSYRYLDGAVSLPDRKKAEDEFQRGEADFFLISLKAGGLGLNLTAANYVILLDPWWNPAVEDQAADRAYRIGQKNPVTVYRLIVSDSVESRVVEMHGSKRKMANDLLDDASDGSLSADELMSLFGPE